MKWRSFITFLFLTAFHHQTWSVEYHFISRSMSWDSALSFCRAQHTDLASVSDQTQWSQLRKAAAENSAGGRTGLVWIGLLDDLSKWSWSRPDSGSEDIETGLEYSNWAPSEPDNRRGSQMCVLMSPGGRWRDENCDEKKTFVCSRLSDKGGPQFFSIRQEMTWADARGFCRDVGLDLARIRNSEENDLVESQAKDQEVWLGLHRTRVWSDGTRAHVEFWGRGQPDNEGGSQHCTAMSLDSGLWWDEDCDEELPFVCYSAQEHVLGLAVRLSSKKALTEDQLRDLVSTEVLMTLGLPDETKMTLKTAKLNETRAQDEDKD